MSGHLMGMVMDHGPQDHNAYAVALVIAEDMHHAGDTALMTHEALAARARLSVRSVRRGVEILRVDGWVHCTPGNGRGKAGVYRLLMDRFPVESLPRKGGHTDHLWAVDTGEKGGHTDHLSAVKVATQSLKVATQATPTVTVKDPSSSAPPDPSPAARITPADDDAIPENTPNDDPVLATLDGLPGRPYPAPDVARLIDQCLTAGWNVDALRAELDGALGGTGIRSHMAVTRAALKSLADTAPPPTATPEAEWPEWCGRCGGPDHAQRWVTLADGAARCRRCNPYAPGYGTPEPIQRPLTTYAVPTVNGQAHDTDAVGHALASYFRMPPSRTGTT